MGAAVPIIGKVILSVLVSKVVTAVGVKLGLDEGFAQVIGAGVGIYAGTAVGGAPTAETPTAGMDLNEGLQDLSSLGDVGGVQAPIAPSTEITPEMNEGLASGAQAGITDPSGQGPGGEIGAPSTGGGMLTQGAIPAVKAPQISNPNVGQSQQGVAKQVIDESVPGADDPNVEPSYWQKLFSPERTMDMILGGIGGIGKYQQAKEDREYPESVVRQNASDWLSRGTGGLRQMRNQSPGQGYLSSYK